MSASKEFRSYFAQKNLKKTFKDYFHFNSAMGIDKITYNKFNEKLDENIHIINKKVLNNTYKFTNYKEKLLLKSRNSIPRLISIPTLRDKLVLKSLHLTLQKVYKNEIIQPLPQSCIAKINSKLSQFNSFFKIDFTNFYGSIQHGILLNRLAKRIKKKEIIDLIQDAIRKPTVPIGSKSNTLNSTGVPQGLPISNILAHIYLLDFDKKYMNRNDIKYIRYVDDIIVLCNEKDKNKIMQEMIYDIEAIHALQINSSKTVDGRISDGFDFLGYKISKEKNDSILEVKTANKYKIENSLVKIFTKFKYNKKKSPEEFIYTVNRVITGSISKKVEGKSTETYYYGWLFYFNKITDIGFLYHLDRLIEKYFNQNEKCVKEVNFNEIKKFHKAFFEIKYNLKDSNYIHRPDDLSYAEKKELLIDVFKINSHKLSTEEKIDKHYRRVVYKPIRDFEKDILIDRY